MEQAIIQLHQNVLGALWPALRGVPEWMVMAVALIVGGALALAWMALMALVWTYGERRIAGFIQARLGPNRVGPMGILQPLADGIKLLVKEDIIPAVAHRTLYTLAPLLVFVGAMLPFAALPFSERLVVSNMALGIYFILAFEAIEVIGILMAGWAPQSKWSLYGGMRLAAQMLSYEIPLGLCILVIVMLAGSMNLSDIVAWQAGPLSLFGLVTVKSPIITGVLGWAIFRSPAALVAFVIFYLGGLAATKRAPFDLPEAESELVAGYHTEYSGMRFSFFFMAEYAAMYVICAVAAILFLGGWHGPIPRPAVPEGAHLGAIWAGLVHAASPGPHGVFFKLSLLVSTLWTTLFQGDGLRIAAHEAIGVVNLLLKAFALYFVMIWVRWTLPRVRIDQVMYLCLKVLLPFGLACVVWAAIQTVLFG